MAPGVRDTDASVVRISAIVCTHDRAAGLRCTLGSLAKQSLPSGCYEIVVVDNASSDETRSVVCEEFAHLPNLHYVNEPQLGLSAARNTGGRKATGAYVAYIDDDAIGPPEWLERILTAFEEVHPTPGTVGGRIEPIWEVPRPIWLPDYCLPFLTVLDLSPRPMVLPEGQFLVGTNMAFPRDLLESGASFPTELGPVGTRFGSGEETMLQRHIRAAGYTLYYDPSICVHHVVPESRLTRSWLLRRMYWEGISRARQTLYAECPGILGRLRLIGTGLRKVTSSPRRLAALASPVDTPDIFRRKASSCRRLGYLVGMLSLRRRIRDAG